MEKIRDRLLNAAKKEKPKEYRNGYVDAILDFFNEIRREASK